MKVRDFMRNNPRQVITARENTSIPATMSLLLHNRISCLPILDDQAELVGIISDKDIFRAAYEDPHGFVDLSVKQLMTTNLLVGLADDDLDYIAGVMTNNRIRHVPIVENKRLIGLLSVGDIVKSQLKNIQIENRYLWKYISDEYPG
ncbi:MAG: CBS domain-containing protein [candidate division Zixibacteria bacterium]|nr:CBS domain-containing protein [candidate division Zixibacteria bacterium]